ncbi:MAG: hypothetical protein K2Q97_16115 [Burkholderiaceae bacterium]|nr:hypothetical protein [Burkholderiaceae bacterium]
MTAARDCPRLGLLPAHAKRLLAHHGPTRRPPGPAAGRSRQPSGTGRGAPCARFLADDYSLLDADQVHWQHLLGYRQITDSSLLGLAVRHQCRFVSFDAQLNLHAVPGARAERLITL